LHLITSSTIACTHSWPQAEEEENMGDVDLWMLAEDGNALTVNARWLQHLQDRLLGDDGHPRKVCVWERMGTGRKGVFGRGWASMEGVDLGKDGHPQICVFEKRGKGGKHVQVK